MNELRGQIRVLLDAADFATEPGAPLAWDARKGGLILIQRQVLRLPEVTRDQALKRWRESPAVVNDPFGFLAALTPDKTGVVFGDRWPAVDWQALTGLSLGREEPVTEETEPFPVTAPLGTFVDLAVGGDGRLALPYTDGLQHGLLVFHLKERWRARVELPERPVRAVVDRDQQIWVVGGSSLTLCAGEPLPLPYTPRAARFEPERINPQPLRVLWSIDLWATAPDEAPPQLADFRAGNADSPILALTTDADSVILLVWDRIDGETGFRQRLLVRRRSEDRTVPVETFLVEDDLPMATDVEMLAPGRLALLVPFSAADRQRSGAERPERPDCPVFRLERSGDDAIGRAVLIRERHPQVSQDSARLVSAMDGRVRYLARQGPLELQALPQPRYPVGKDGAWLTSTLLEPLDSGTEQTQWHRLYLEAAIPPGCELEIRARTFDHLVPAAADSANGGDADGGDADDGDAAADLPALLPPPDEEASFLVQPRPLWLHMSSVLPHAEGRFDPLPQVQGIFEILLQRPGGVVRELRGRYLQLRVAMRGDGRHTPCIHWIRAQFPRNCWQEAWLPEHFRQQQAVDTGPEAATRPANGADLRQRLLASFEGVLSPIEDRIVTAEILLQPRCAPAANLPAIAAMMGCPLPTYWPLARQRRWLACQGVLQRNKGTIDGLQLALDIATDGAVRRGQVVAVEHFRLRRTRATLLGLDLDDRDHPLTLGTGETGNSIVGDTLFLSEEEAWEFLALLAPEIVAGEASRAAKVEQFFDRYGHRLTVLLHGDARRQQENVARLLAEQMPAHLGWSIATTDHPFVLGLSPLLGIDTFLELEPEPDGVQLDESRVGRGDLVLQPAAFSPLLAQTLSQARQPDGASP